MLGNLQAAKACTAEAAKINKHHPCISLNTAFFRILEKRYDGALFWYKKISKMRGIDVNVPELIEFLIDRYNENKKELAYVFALGIMSYKFYDQKKGLSDLTNFISRAKDKNQYNGMVKYAKNIVEAEKIRTRNSI